MDLKTEKKRIDITIGNNIRQEREKAKYTHDQFSELLGIQSKSLSAIERGVVGISMVTLQKICKILAISSDKILFGTLPERNAQDLAMRFERLSPKQYEIASDVVFKVLEAFALDESNEEA